jgi:hypothetical protein
MKSTFLSCGAKRHQISFVQFFVCNSLPRSTCLPRSVSAAGLLERCAVDHEANQVSLRLYVYLAIPVRRLDAKDQKPNGLTPEVRIGGGEGPSPNQCDLDIDRRRAREVRDHRYVFLVVLIRSFDLR